MPDTSPSDKAHTPDSARLDALRHDIDTADREMHRLLIHRGEVIEQLIEAKRLTTNGGGAFRPDREAAMMRSIQERHTGRLPLSTVEHIWREIIGTFTQLQAPYRVLAARAADPAMRDLLRYYFGFSSPLVATATNREAVETVARTGTDLAVVAVDDPLEERWWEAFTPPEAAPQTATGAHVIACLPFLPLTSGLDLPRALVIGPANVTAPDDLHLYAVKNAPAGCGTSLARSGDMALVASPLPPDDFATAAAAVDKPTWLGSFAKPTDWT